MRKTRVKKPELLEKDAQFRILGLAQARQQVAEQQTGVLWMALKTVMGDGRAADMMGAIDRRIKEIVAKSDPNEPVTFSQVEVIVRCEVEAWYLKEGSRAAPHQ